MAERVELTDARREKIETCLKVYDKCKDKERQFLDTCKLILEDDDKTWMTVGREKFLDSIIKFHINGETTYVEEKDLHDGDFHAFKTNDGWEVYWNKERIGQPVAKREVKTILSFLSRSIDQMMSLVTEPTEEVSAGFPDPEPETKEEVVEEEVVAEVAETIYADENSPTGFVDEYGGIVNEYGQTCDDEGSVIPF